MNRLPALVPVQDMAELLSKMSGKNVDDDLHWLLEGIKYREIKFFSPAGDPGDRDHLGISLAFLAPTGTPATEDKAKLVNLILAETCVRPRDVLAYMKTARALSDICAPSDAALGAETHRSMNDLATRPREQTKKRQSEWVRWHNEAERIKGEYIKKFPKRDEPSVRELAKQVKKSLGLPDSEETIRKRIAKIRKEKTSA